MAKRTKTDAQVLVTAGVDGVLMKTSPSGWGKKVREMRRDPTLGFLRDIYMAPMLIAQWTVVSDREDGDQDDPRFAEAESLLDRCLVKRQKQILRSTLRGFLEWGWQPFEMVHDYVKGPDGNGTIELVKVKPLLQDITEILVDDNGELRGVRNRPTFLNSFRVPSFEGHGLWVDLIGEEQLVFSHDVEGTNWYGEAVYRRAEIPYLAWNTCEEAAQRFDKKIAGAHWVVWYPDGRSRYNGVDEVENFEIARRILTALEASGSVAIPNVVAKEISDLNDLSDSKLGWKIDILSAPTTAAASFVERQRYHDSLKSRAMGIPERAVLEGQFGTKAEAEAHADFAIDAMESIHADITDRLNETETNFLLEVNYGPDMKGKVRIVAPPLSDFQRSRIWNLYMSWLASPDGAATEADAVDWDAARQELNIPTRRDIAQGAGEPAGRSSQQ